MIIIYKIIDVIISVVLFTVSFISAFFVTLPYNSRIVNTEVVSLFGNSISFKTIRNGPIFGMKLSRY